MLRELVCIVCPNGCELAAEVVGKTILSATGAQCKRGDAYLRQEILDPKRNIASSVKVVGGELPLVSVRLTEVIAKEMIFTVMDEIKQAVVNAPVKIGQVLIGDVAGSGVNVVATKNVEAVPPRLSF